MADNTYVIEQRAPTGPTVTIDDDGTGIDWLVFSGIYNTQTSVTLMWAYSDGVPTQASATYWTDAGPTGRLVVNGIIENVRGSDGKDWITGNQVSNILYGDQTADGEGGNDVLYGDEGDDTIYGGAGNDDVSGAEDNDALYGGVGDDTVSGGAGVDLVEGGAGADVLSGGSSIGDTLSYESSGAGVVIEINQGSTTAGAGGDAEGDSIYGFSDVIGSGFGDVITDIVKGTVAFDYNKNQFFGGAGSDTLKLGGGNDIGHGDEGDDTLAGELGADILTGGANKDRFVFLAISDSTVAANGRDTITDFSRLEKDIIDLELIDANGKKRGDQDFDFIGTDSFSRHAGELRIKESGDGYLVQGDTDGNKKADFAIFVDDFGRLKAGDFDL